MIAVNDGKIIKIGENEKLGRYLELQDATGNIYTYANLGSVPHRYAVPKPVHVTAKQIAKQLSRPMATTATPKTPAPTKPATAGSQQSSPTPSAASATKQIDTAAQRSAASASAAPRSSDAAAPIAAPMVKERLFASPHRPNSYAAGGAVQIKSTSSEITNFNDYFSDVLHLAKNQYTLKPLKAGAVVVAGTILGRIGQGTKSDAAHLEFMVRPAGKNAPQIDPKPILDGWKLLEATAVYRADGVDPFFGPGAKNPTIGQVLLMSKEQLQTRVLEDPTSRSIPADVATSRPG